MGINMKAKWWHDKIAYQIYPKSFCCSNGDGIGDIPGIISKLDYLKSLGIDVIWLSPVYRSPFMDEGYDISDYYDIDPVFGSMNDMRTLICEAKKRDMHILMDLVVNHCSDKHQWFQKALSDPTGEYADYFYIRKGKAGGPPSNLGTYFGGSAWERIGDSEYFYLHLFSKGQPDLNWENPRVRREIYDMVNFWLDMGLSGFRLDAIINIKKDTSFPDYPSARADGLASPTCALARDNGVLDLLDELSRKTFKKHDALAIAELFDYRKSDLARYIGDSGCFSTIFDFNEVCLGHTKNGWYDTVPITAKAYRDAMFKSHSLSDKIGFVANIIENHDEPRGVSRYIPAGCLNSASKKLLALILLTRRGLPFIYQGQEIGMENCPFLDISEFDDIATKNQYAIALGAGLTEREALEAVCKFSRDNSRTPFQWSDVENAGFTSGTPWLKVNPNYSKLNLKAQLNDDNSVFSFYKRLIALRKSEEYGQTLTFGELEPAYLDNDEIIAFYRRHNGKTLLSISNFSTRANELAISSSAARVVINNMGSLALSDDTLTLEPYQAVLLEL